MTLPKPERNRPQWSNQKTHPPRPPAFLSKSLSNKPKSTRLPPQRPKAPPPLPPQPPAPPKFALPLNVVEKEETQNTRRCSKCPCTKWSFKANAFLTIFILSCFGILFFSLFIWSVVPKTQSKSSPQHSTTVSSEPQSRIICIHHDNDNQDFLRNQCLMIKDYCDEMKSCKAFVFHSAVDETLMRYFWAKEKFDKPTIFYVATHGSEIAVSDWSHKDLIQNVQEFYKENSKKAAKFLLATTACHSGKIVRNEAYKKNAFPIITALGTGVALCSFNSDEGKEPSSALPHLLTNNVFVPSLEFQKWTALARETFKSTARKLNKPITERLEFGMEDAKARRTYQEQNLPTLPIQRVINGLNGQKFVINEAPAAKKGNHGFTISVASGSSLNLKDFNINPNHYAVQVTARTPPISYPAGRICQEHFFPRQELGIPQEVKSLWVRSKTIARHENEPRQKFEKERHMKHEDFLAAGKYTIETTEKGEKICTDRTNSEELQKEMQPSFVLLPIPMV